MDLKVYAIFEGNQIIKMSHNLDEMVDYILSFSRQDRIKFSLCEKIVYQGLISYKSINILSYIPEKIKKEAKEK